MTTKSPVMKYGIDQAWTSARVERHNNVYFTLQV